jgi:hypothetical protein
MRNGIFGARIMIFNTLCVLTDLLYIFSSCLFNTLCVSTDLLSVLQLRPVETGW